MKNFKRPKMHSRSKPYIFTLFYLLLFFSSHSYGQEFKPTSFIGVHIAPSVYIHYGPHDFYGYTTYFNPGASLIAGGSTEVNFSPRFAFHAELNYEQLRYSYFEVPNGKELHGKLPVNTSVKSQFISIPLSFKYHFISQNKTRLFLNFGNYWNYNVHTQVTEAFLNEPARHSDSKDDLHLRLGLLTGLGLNRVIGEYLRLTFEIRNQFMLVNDPGRILNENTYDDTFGNTIGILAGLQFQFGARE